MFENEKLTPSELKVLELVAKGLPNRTIARELFLAEKTVENRLTVIYRKIGVNARAQATSWHKERELLWATTEDLEELLEDVDNIRRSGGAVFATQFLPGTIKRIEELRSKRPGHEVRERIDFLISKALLKTVLFLCFT